MSKPLPAPSESETLLVFSTCLDWMAVRTAGAILRQLSFGHRSARAAAEATGPAIQPSLPRGLWQESLADRLNAYAKGRPIDFRDLLVDPGHLTPFQAKVLRACREIPYGRTVTYGELAVLAGSPKAARAVGNCMASNPIPLVVPCHRVVLASGATGPYSAPGGTRMKRRLLEMEARVFLASGPQLD